MAEPATLGEYLRAAREQAGLSQRQLASRVGIHNSYLARLENGATQTFYITGGGSLFQLGPDVNASQQVNIGIQSIADSQLGGTNISGTVLLQDG